MRFHDARLLAAAALVVLCAMGAPARAADSTTQSIKRWAACDGHADDTVATAKAFAAAKQGAFTLIVDCPVRLHFGSEVGRSVFIEDGTHVTFTGAGKMIVDNVFQPAFVVANASDITLTNWDVEYQGGLPANPDTGGFQREGKFVAQRGRFQPAAAFNDTHITSWLAKNRGINFDQTLGHVSSVWVGPTNTSSLFFISGDVARLRVTGMRLHVPADAGAERFIPMAFSFSRNYKSRQGINNTTPQTAQFVAVPHDLMFSDIDLDGTYMGFQGNLQDATFEHIRSHRYADLQDAQGGSVGGVGKWFAPPHLFYLNYAKDGDPSLFNRNITIRDIIDSGPRLGKARDGGKGDTISGNALSLKVGGVNVVVDGYQSNRPDGFMDVLTSDGLTVSNVQASYDSSFLNNLYPGLRFPDSPYSNITFRNVVLTDLAPQTVQRPIGNAKESTNSHIVFTDVQVKLNQWAGSGSIQPAMAGANNQVSIDFVTRSDR